MAPMEMAPKMAANNIMAKEMAPILLSCGVWGPLLAPSRVKFECDNSSIVAAIQKGSANLKMIPQCVFYDAYG